MVDSLRAYRRWLAGRLAVLVPAFLAALGANLWIALAARPALWVKVSALAACTFVTAFLGYFLVQATVCFRLQRRGRGAAARPLRAQLSIHRPAAAVSLAVLAGVVAATLYFPEPAPPRLPPRPARRPRPVVEPEAAPVARLEPIPAAPEMVPALMEVPATLLLTERDFEPPAIDPLPGLDRRPDAVAAGPDSEENLPAFRPDGDSPFLPYDRFALFIFERPGLPDERDSSSFMAAEVRLDFLFLSMDGNDRGGGAELTMDLPFTRDESFRAALITAVFMDGEEFFEGDGERSWERVTLEYVRRLAGYTRSATFDLAVSAGVGLDRFAGDDAVEGDARLSPHVGIDAAFWQRGTMGLLLHAGYSLPLNVNGASSEVLDLAAVLRLDLSENISLRFGYRWMVVRLREYEDPFTTGASRAELADSFAGPLVGIDIRF